MAAALLAKLAAPTALFQDAALTAKLVLVKLLDAPTPPSFPAMALISAALLARLVVPMMLELQPAVEQLLPQTHLHLMALVMALELMPLSLLLPRPAVSLPQLSELPLLPALLLHTQLPPAILEQLALLPLLLPLVLLFWVLKLDLERPVWHWSEWPLH